MPDMLEFENGESLAAHILDGHVQHNAKDQRPHDEALFELRLFCVVGIDMQRVVVHSEHAEERIVVLGNGATGPVLINGSDLKLFKTATKLHLDPSLLRFHSTSSGLMVYCSSRGAARACSYFEMYICNNWRAIIRRWISLVPSPTSIKGASR